MDDCCPFAALVRKAPLALLLAALCLLGWTFRGTAEARSKEPKAKTGSWPMFGGSPSRNMVNTADRKVLTSWQTEGPAKDIKWSVKIGTRGYTTPVIAGGKVFVATNNGAPRNPKVKGSKAVL